MKTEQEKYFVVVSLPYEGDCLSEFDSEEEARKDYNRTDSSSSYYLGSMLIRGTVLERWGEVI